MTIHNSKYSDQKNITILSILMGFFSKLKKSQ